MCWPASRQRLAKAGSLVLKIWKHRPKAAALRPARLGLMSDPAAPALNTGRLRMYRYRGSVPPKVSSAWGSRQMS